MPASLTLEGGGGVVPIESISEVKSLRSAYFYFQVVTTVNLYAYVTLTINDKVIPCYVVKAMAMGDSRSVTSLLVSVKQKETFEVLASPYVGDCTVELLINSVGLSGCEADKSETFHWVVRECSCYNFMRYVAAYAKTKQGGAPYLTMSFDGDIIYFDVRHRLEYGDAKEIEAAIVSREDDFRYQLANPTNTDLITFEEGEEALTNIGIGSSRDIYTAVYFNDYAREYYYNYHSNIANRTMVERTMITIQTMSTVVQVGDLVRLKGLPIKGVALEVSQPVSLADNVPLPITIKLSCQLYEQKC